MDDASTRSVRRRCRKCSSERPDLVCWKCGDDTFIPPEGWDEPALPDVDRIRALAKEVGYAIGEHGSRQRDLDLIAAPWVDDAVDPHTLACHIALGVKARVVDGGPKPLGRYGFNLQIDGWFKLIDLSVCPRVPSANGCISSASKGPVNG